MDFDIHVKNVNITQCLMLTDYMYKCVVLVLFGEKQAYGLVYSDRCVQQTKCTTHPFHSCLQLEQAGTYYNITVELEQYPPSFGL